MSLDLELAAPETVYRVLSEDGSELVADPPAVSDDDLVAGHGRDGQGPGGQRPVLLPPAPGPGRAPTPRSRARRPSSPGPPPPSTRPATGCCPSTGSRSPSAATAPRCCGPTPSTSGAIPAGGHFPAPIRVFPVQISLAAQIPHALGLAWAMQLQGRGRRGLRLLRRRRQLGGRLLRGRQLRRRARGAGAVPVRQQRLGHLHPAGQPDGGGQLRRQGGRLRLPRRAGRRQRRPGHDLGRRRRPGAGGDRRRADAHRGRDLPDGPPHHRRRPEALPAARGAGRLGGPGPDPSASAATWRAGACGTTTAMPKPKRPPPPRSTPPGTPPRPPPSPPDAFFDHVYAEPTPRMVTPAGRAAGPPRARRQPGDSGSEG